MRQRFATIQTFLRGNRFIVTVIGAVAISTVLVTISLIIYVRDGAILLDLSRPSYAPVRERINKEDGTPGFSSDGKINAEVVKDFREQLNRRIKEMKELEGFDASAINDKALQLE